MSGDSDTFTIGAARLRFLVDVDAFAMKIGWFLPTADLSRLVEHRHWLEPVVMRGDELLIDIQTAVLEVAGKVVLIDTCIGEDKERPVRPEWHQRRATGFLARLAAMGIAPEDVDIVLCTHLHADHVGWNTRLLDGRWVPTFPNARYLMGRTELAFWEQERARIGDGVNHHSIVDSVLPVVAAGLVDLVEPGEVPFEGARLRALPGHTTGQIGLELESRGETALFVGDAIHHPVQMIEPGWSSALDTDPAAAALTRRAFLSEMAETGGLLVPGHFRACRACRIEKAGADSYSFRCN